MDTAISGSHQETVRQKGSSKCPNHRQKDVVYVCQDCEILLCITCRIQSVHKNHNLEELSVIAQKKKTTMLDFVNQSENNTLPYLKEDIKANAYQTAEASAEFKIISSSMKHQGDKCKQEIDKLIAGFTFICEEMVRSNFELLRHQNEDKQHKYDVVLSEVKECKKALQTGMDFEIFDTDFDTLGSYTETNPPALQTCQYTPCTTITDHLKQAIGNFITGSTDHLQTFGNAKSVSDTSDSFQESTSDHTEIANACTNAGKSTGHPSSCELLNGSILVPKFSCSTTAWLMTITPECYFWILEYDRKTVLQINDKGETKQKIELDNVTNDICVSPVTGRLWFCCKDGTIYELQESATPVPQFKVKEEPFCLCKTNSGVIIGSENSLTIYSVTGSIKRTITNKGYSNCVSNCPVTKHIAVVHITPDNNSGEDFPYDSTMYIAVYDRTLNHLFTYRGEGIRGQQPVTPETFGPYRIVYDCFGNLIMTDKKRSITELLSGTGQYLRTLHSGLEQIGVICIGSGNTLWCQMIDDEKGNFTMKLLKYCK